MSFSQSTCENSPEPAISDVCMNLEAQYLEDLSKAEGMRVFARVRPLLNTEIEAGYKECIGTIDEQTIRAFVPASSVKYKSSSHFNQDLIEDFKFSASYGPEVGQFVFFEESMMSTMLNFIEGQNSLVFSYGITGSGKTYTLQGDPNNPGIIPLSLYLFFASVEDQLFNRIAVKPDKFDDVLILNDNEIKKEHQLMEQLLSTNNQEVYEEWNFKNSSAKSLAMVLCATFSDKFEGEGCQTTLGPEDMAQAQAAALMKELSKKSAEQQAGYCSVWVSFVEIYNEYAYDLLQPNVNQRTKLTLGEDKGNVYVKGLREVCVFNSYDALKLLNFGQRNLKIASTKLNYQSSRSHCIFTIKVIRIPDPENIASVKVNRLSFCDLAGSERAAKSQTTGLRLKEAGCINTSLFVLGRCLEQLRLNPSQRDKKLIPFRESKLTRLLSGFFTGTGKAVMITNASPSEVTFDETLHALRFSAVATELIINDSYIATASNTLQTITNMWTNARENVSISSDKSISFDDSVAEALHEKDELIEKLLDLADSLRNNLEKEKKEKAELEIKIRRDVCEEYSKYSDELLESQKNTYEQEGEAIREIYKKRISAMEKMYEKIIDGYKLHIEESDSSCDEVADDTGSDGLVHKGVNRNSVVSEKSFKGETKENIELQENYNKDNFLTGTKGFLNDMEILKEDLKTISEELNRTKEELKKSKDYCSALETATEEMEKKLEISNFNLEKALTENGELKIRIDYLHASYEDNSLENEIDRQSNIASDTLEEQLEGVKLQLKNTLKINEDLKEESDALKIDCVSYKVDNENLFKKNMALDEQLKSLSDELASTKSEKEDLFHKLAESEMNVANLGDEVKTLLGRINELTNLLEESKEEYEKSLEESRKKTKEAEEILKSVNQTLCNALIVTEEQKKILAVHETDCVHLKYEMINILKINDDLKEKCASAFKELEFEKSKAKSESSEIENTLQKTEKLTIELDAMKSECQQYKEKVSSLNEINLNLKEKLSSNLKELELEKNSSKSNSDDLEKALQTIKEQADDVKTLKFESIRYKGEMCTLQETYLSMEEKLSSVSKELESEKVVHKQELDTLNIRLEEILTTTKKQKFEMEKLLDIKNCYQNEIAELQKSNKELVDKLSIQTSETESEKTVYKKELDILNSKFGEALDTIENQKVEVQQKLLKNNSYQTEIAELQKSNKELVDKLGMQASQAESETLAYKKELDSVNNKFSEALCTVDKQKQEVENLTNIIKSDKNIIEELERQNKKLQDNINFQTDLEILVSKREFDYVNIKLSEALSSLDKQKQEIENLLNIINSAKNEIAELQKQNKELQDKNSEAGSEILMCKEELESVNNKLAETLSDLDKQKKEVENLTNAINSDRSEIAELQKENKELQKNMNSQSDMLYELIQVLEKCELQATHKIDLVQSVFAAFKDENKNLKEQIKKNSDDHENDCHILLKMVQILQKCEMFASNKTKELHSSSIKHVELIMDLEKCVKQREANIEVLKTDYNLLQKQLKDLQATSKKQLQTEKQQYKSEIDSIITEKTVIEKEKKSLKDQVMQLEDLKDKLKTEVENMKIQFEKVVESKNQAQINEKKSKANIEDKYTNEKRIGVLTMEEEEKSSVKQILRKAKNQGEKRKNKSNEKSVTILEDKKPEAKIQEENDENSNNGKTQKTRNTGRKQLRCVKNVTRDMELVYNKDLSSAKSKGSKRKEQDESFEDKLHVKKILKSIKLQDINDIENISSISKPLNLRVKLLKDNVMTNDIPVPSPRMTRGRRRLCILNAKKDISKNKGSPRTVRS